MSVIERAGLLCKTLRRSVPWRKRGGTVSVLFATAALPLLALIGLATDYGIWNQVNASMQLAADTAALNAVKIASNGELTGDANYLNDGIAAGTQWFTGAASQYVNRIKRKSLNSIVTVVGTTTVTATVTYSAEVTSVFGAWLAGINVYLVSGQSSATVSSAPYLDVEIMLDNSSSMQIGASYQDIENMMYWTACDPNEAWYNLPSTGPYKDYGIPYGYPGANAVQPYTNAYVNYGAQFAYTNQVYEPTQGGPTYPLLLPPGQYAGFQPFAPPTGPDFLTGPNNSQFEGGYSCKGWLPQNTQYTPGGNIEQYPLAGEPCAFACHSDGSKPAGTGNDFYADARRSIGTSHEVHLRFDKVKEATNLVIKAMRGYDLPVHNLNVGVFTFNDTLKQVYPAAGSVCGDGAPVGEACDDWNQAIEDVGAPPKVAGGQDTGIQPEVLIGASAHMDTNFTGTMQQLSQMLSAAGAGLTPAQPRKVLFLVTDGVSDYNGVGAFDYNQCTTFKNMGYTVYVVYTPYYPLMDFAYLALANAAVTGTGPGSVSYNLQKCSSDPANDYIAATSAKELKSALQTFLQNALTAPIRFQS
jgi:Flp pilus assembly protein TadG